VVPLAAEPQAVKVKMKIAKLVRVIFFIVSPKYFQYGGLDTG
jgi:hypothetical protein